MQQNSLFIGSPSKGNGLSKVVLVMLLVVIWIILFNLADSMHVQYGNE